MRVRVVNEPIRPPVTLTVNLKFLLREDRWRADSPDLDGFCVYGVSIQEARRKVREALEPWLGDHVTLEFRDVDEPYY